MVRARSSTQPCAAPHPNRINARAPTPYHCAQRRAFADVPAAAHLLPDAASRPREVVGGRAAAARSGVALPGWHAAAGHIFAAAAAPPICRAGSSLWQRTRSTRDAAVDLLGRRSGGGNVPLAAAALSAPAVADASAPHTAAAAAPSVRGRASPAHVSPILGPQLTTPPASWSANARDVLDSPAECPPSHYSNINALLAHLHTERVNAGARQRWLDDDDDDEDL